MPRQVVCAYIGLGANLGDAAAQVKKALADLAAWPDIALIQASPLYRSAPIDSSGPDYINAVAEIHTSLCAPALHTVLQTLERRAGRQRPTRNAPRTLDLDLLLYGQGRIDSPHLTLPHPRMWQRAFVLLPLAHIAPQQVSAEQLEWVRNQSISPL